jgi:asparagine synthase (glutamine-hydrolysing)
MCGIAGIIDFQTDQPPDRDLLLKMIGFIQHRGPDATGLYIAGPAGLAHARLSIIDLSGGDQPIHNEDKSVWIVFNGEIFNYPDLREDLEAKGHRFYTRTDTEILVHMYEEFGPEMFKDLNGQFAFAIWDKKREVLFLARDRMGIRPLFYFQDGRRFLFGSEIKSIFADASVPRRLDVQTLGDVFTCWSPIDPLTSFEGIRQLPAAHYAVFSRAGFEVRPYWKLRFNPAAQDAKETSLSDWSEGLSELLIDATRIRLRADVPVGAYLSGGLDSTLTSAIVKRNFNNLLRTFSVNFADSRFDEGSFQAKAVEALATDHSRVRCTDTDIGVDFPRIVWHTETPLVRTAPAPLYRLSRLVRENNFKVVLTGEGADEMFAGYNIFKEDRVRRFWARNPESRMRPQLLKKLYPYIFAQKDGKAGKILEGFFKRGLLETGSPVYSHLVRWSNTAQVQNFFSADLRAKAGDLQAFVERYAKDLPDGFMSWHPLSRAQYTEIRIFLTNYLLSSQGDRMAMANAVEGRYPFLDYRVVEYAARTPPRFKLNGLTEKFILKEIARQHIPQELIDRPKQPYRAPISGCFFGDQPPEYVEEVLSPAAVKRARVFDPVKVQRLVAKCKTNAGQLLSERENMAVAGIISTQLLHRQFIASFPVRPPAQSAEPKIYS